MLLRSVYGAIVTDDHNISNNVDLGKKSRIAMFDLEDEFST